MKSKYLASNRVLKLVFICIFSIGAYLRFFGLYESIWSSSYDETRDTIVASHFIKYGEFLTRGPNVSTPYLLNPPTYYYFISSLFLIGGSVWGAKLLWASILATTVLFAYILGATVWDKKLGLISALFVAIHPTFVIPMQLMSQTMVLPILMFIVLIFLFQRRQTISSLSLGIWFLLLGLHAHYSIFIVLPFLSVWWSITYFLFLKNYTSVQMWKSFIPAAVGIVGLVLWILLSYQSLPLDQLAILKIGNTQSVMHYISQIKVAISEYIYTLFYWYVRPDATELSVFIIGFVLCGIWSIYVTRRIVQKNILFLSLLIGLNILPFLLAGKFTGTIYTAYVLTLLPIGIFTVAFIVRALMHTRFYVGICVLMILTGYFGRMTFLDINNRSDISYYESSRRIAVAIYMDNIRLTYPNSDIYPFTIRFVVVNEKTELNEWLSGGIWFHLESITKKKLVELKETDADFQSIEQHPEYTYIVCDSRPVAGAATLADVCDSTKELLQGKYNQVFYQIYQNYPYSVWRMKGSEEGV